MQLLTEGLPCPIGNFPSTYLGLPLSIRKQTAGQLQGFVDSVAAHLPTWKAASMPKGSRLIYAKSVLCAVPVHAMLALDLPAKIFISLNKVVRNFLCCKRADARGGNCAVAWSVVCAHKSKGGLGLPNFKAMNLALRARCNWIKRSEPDKPWQEFHIPVPADSMALFRTATSFTIGNGKSTIFWTDKWLGSSALAVEFPYPSLCTQANWEETLCRRCARGQYLAQRHRPQPL